MLEVKEAIHRRLHPNDMNWAIFLFDSGNLVVFRKIRMDNVKLRLSRFNDNSSKKSTVTKNNCCCVPLTKSWTPSHNPCQLLNSLHASCYWTIARKEIPTRARQTRLEIQTRAMHIPPIKNRVSITTQAPETKATVSIQMRLCNSLLFCSQRT